MEVSYQVLARKYRPSGFKDLVGQETLVRTISNAFKLNRVAHAFLLTGIRGIGKTTTARIVAKALNCTNLQTLDGGVIEPCGECSNCKSIATGSNPDIIEIDAASRTGVGDIREIIENVRYLPVSAKYKIYIIDEVHMLSTNAFNALLKTLEEPPAHVKFIFATTEVRKIPITIISRCQRFDLRRLTLEELASHLGNIAKLENYDVSEGALKLLASFAEGSVRDGLSLLDRVICYSLVEDKAQIDETLTRAVLGLSSSIKIFEFLEEIFQGKVVEALASAESLYKEGGDILTIIKDMLEAVSAVAKAKSIGAAYNSVTLTEEELLKAKHMAGALSVSSLSRIWQMLLKAIEDIKFAEHRFSAFEMIVIKLCHASLLPDPTDLIRKLRGEQVSFGSSPEVSFKEESRDFAPVASLLGGYDLVKMPVSDNQNIVKQTKIVAKIVEINSFADIVAEATVRNELMLYHHLHEDVGFISLKSKALEVSLTSAAPRSFAKQLESKLGEWTGEAWQVIVSNDVKAKTLSEIDAESKSEELRYYQEHETVKAVLESFDGAKISSIRKAS